MLSKRKRWVIRPYELLASKVKIKPVKCWNCLHSNPAKSHRCERCDQALVPTPVQSRGSRRHVEYLIQEAQQWEFVPEEVRQRLSSVYRQRLTRLHQLEHEGIKSASAWPESDWGLPDPVAETSAPEPSEAQVEAPESEHEPAPQPEPVSVTPSFEDTPLDLSIGEEAPEEVPIAVSAPGPIDEEPSYLQKLTGEADIRWFHSLGTLLVVAAVVGWLRASWDSYGRALTGWLIAVSPLILHALVSRLKQSVPLSARLLSILGNVLTPLALLSLDVFDNLPPQIPSDLWWTFSLCVSSAVLLTQAHKTREKMPLYLGGLSCIMAGWSQGALTTALLSLALGFFFHWDGSEEDAEWLRHRRQLGFYAGTFGAAASLLLFDTSRHPTVPVAAFTIALLFLSLPQITGHESDDSGRVILQTVVSVIGGILMRAVLHLSPGGVALYLLFATALLLAAKPNSAAARLSAQAAVLLGGLSLIIGFLSDLTQVFQHPAPLHETVLRSLFAAAGAGFFWRSSRRESAQEISLQLFTYALVCLTGGWTHLFFRFDQAHSPIGSPVEPFYTLTTLPIFLGLLLLATPRLKPCEQSAAWQYAGGIYVLSFAASFLYQTVMGRASFDLTLCAHLVLVILWEREWLAVQPIWQEREGHTFLFVLRRAVAASFSITFLTVPDWPFEERCKALLLILGAGVFLAPRSLRKAGSEAYWLLAFGSLFLFTSRYEQLALVLLSFPVTLALEERKPAYLVSASTLGTLFLITSGRDIPLPVAYLPALFFIFAAATPARGERQAACPGSARIGLPVLFITALFCSVPPSAPALNLAYCLTLAFTLGVLQLYLEHPAESDFKVCLRRAVAPRSPLVAAGALVVWSLGQSTLEFGSLLVLGGTALGIHAWKHPRSSPDPTVTMSKEAQLAWGLLLFGLGQLFSSTYFVPHPTVLLVGLLTAEIALNLLRRNPPALTDVALLTVVYVQNPLTLDDISHLLLFTMAAGVLALSALRLDLSWAGAVSSAFFLLGVDELIQGHTLAFKLRILPLAAGLIAVGFWRWKAAPDWPRPALRIGLSLLVIPACLQFLAGVEMMENCAWVLIVGASFIGAHLLLPQDLAQLFRKAGGLTLIAWVTVSFTRAALQLPWQAATLVIGIALVCLGIWAEKKRKGPEQK